MNTDSLTLDQCRRAAVRRLSTEYPPAEAGWMARVIFERLKGYSQTDLIIKAGQPVSDFLAGEVGKVVDRLLAHEPIQYIFGVARWYGMDFKVNRATLIPRPETEELVDMIVDRLGSRSDLAVLDIGTGSGAIAIALALNLKFAQVTAIDISAEALDTAKENARSLHASVKFAQADILTLTPPASPVYDLVVSNPPYITESEKNEVDSNVLMHEPHTALFVPDSDPLKFYRAISLYSLKALRPGGMLWFEINPRFAAPLADMLNRQGWDNVTILPDSRGKQRFACAQLPSR